MKRTLKIQSIFPGLAPSDYYGEEGSFIASTAVDPDFPISSSRVKTSGFCVPIGYSVFSSGTVNSAPIAIINNPKDTKTYVVTAGGRIVSYDSSLGSETNVGTVTGSYAGGAVYYNNYIYVLGTGASKNDVSRYGPLNNSPALANGVWTGATLGSQAVLSNTTYPTLRSVSVPNHWGYVHGDNALYFLDFESKSGGTAPGQGLVHKIKTSKTTDEGDTNNGSSYNALDLPFGFYPTSITGYSTNLVIVGIYTTDNNIEQGKAAFVSWDPTNTTSFFLGPIPLPGTLATASLNADGEVYIWSGNAQNGVTLSRYRGGESVKNELTQEEGLPPLAGAVDYSGDRLVWGGFTANPNDRGCVWSWGSKDPRLPMGMHNIIKASASGSTPIVTSVKKVQQDSYKQPKFVVGWNDGSGSGVDKYSATATLGSNMRWMFNIGKRYDVLKIRIPLAGAVGSNSAIQPACYFDDVSETPSVALPAINNTNYSGKRKVIYKGTQFKDYQGENNLVFELSWSNTDPLAVALPILIDIDEKEDEPQ